jgi:hypothetical protein
MSFIIFNTTQRKYVAPAGMAKSYVRYPNNARRFDTQAAAEADCCGDERVVAHTVQEAPWSWRR